MKLKDALVKDGFLQPGEAGRGRPSKAMIERAKELVAQGWTIDGFSAKPAGDKPAEVSHKPTTPSGVTVADVPDPTRSDSDNAWSDTNAETGEALPKRVRIGMRTVCNNCRSSLTYCPCPSPVVNLDYNLTGVVKFGPKS